MEFKAKGHIDATIRSETDATVSIRVEMGEDDYKKHKFNILKRTQNYIVIDP